MNQSILHRIAINRSGQPLKRFAIARRDEQNKLDGATLSAELNAHIDNSENDNLEHIPRLTLLQLVKLPLDTKFTFRVARGEGENFVGAMRQVLSRTRKKAKRAKMQLDEFKMYQIGEIKKEENHDEITLMRSKSLSPQEESVYDELFNTLKKVQK